MEKSNLPQNSEEKLPKCQLNEEREEKKAASIPVKKNIFVKEQDIAKVQKNYQVSRKLGEGSYGEVHKIYDKKNQTAKARKCFKKSEISQETKNEMINEIEILKQLDHPNILKIYEFYQDSQNFYIITEFCEFGDLADELKNGTFFEKDAAIIMKQLLSAVNYAHNNKVVHRDLKPENIMLDFVEENNFIIKVIDWGVSTYIKSDEGLTHEFGTVEFMAPEVLRKNYNQKCDIWSCGVILYEMLSGRTPFASSCKEENTDQLIEERIKAGEWNFQEDQWNDISDEAKDLITKMLEIDPSARPSAQKCLEHKWFEQSLLINDQKNNLEKSLIKMKKFSSDKKLQSVVLTYIATQQISKEENQKFIQVFSQIDTNSDGVLSRSELINGYRRIFKNEDDQEIEKNVDQIIKSVDLNNNGMIDYSEFVTACMKMKQDQISQGLQDVFSIFDKDENGKITLDEVKNMLGASLGCIEDKIWGDVLDEVDQDGDQQITFGEFEQMMKKYLDRSSQSLSQEF